MHFTEAVVNLKFDEDPRYPQYAQLFEPLCGPATQRPILLEAGATKVGQKRGREEVEEEAPDIVRPCSLLCCCIAVVRCSQQVWGRRNYTRHSSEQIHKQAPDTERPCMHFYIPYTPSELA